MGSRFNDEYSVTPVVAKVAWYSLCMRCSRSVESGRIVGGGKGLVVVWVCGRGFCGCGFLKGVLLGYWDGIFLGWVNGCEFGRRIDFPWEIPNGPWLGYLEGLLDRKSGLTPAG